MTPIPYQRSLLDLVPVTLDTLTLVLSSSLSGPFTFIWCDRLALSKVSHTRPEKLVDLNQVMGNPRGPLVLTALFEVLPLCILAAVSNGTHASNHGMKCVNLLHIP